MKRLSFICIIIASLTYLASCDEGRLDEQNILISQDGGNARLTANVTGIDTWTEGYTLALAGFEDGNEFAVISKNVGSSVTDGACDITLSGIPPEVSSIELCAIDRLRRRVATFASVVYIPGPDTVRIKALSVDISMAKSIQREIFNTTCSQCHGGSNFVAAGLNLTDGHSFSEMISVPSVKIENMYRVHPGESSSSVLYLILSGNASSEWSYDHSVEVVRQEKIDLIRNWIDGGAKNTLEN